MRFLGILALSVLVGLGINVADTQHRSEPSIPHCVSDDYNDGSQEVCYTVRVTDGAYIVINRQDQVISVSAE